MLRHHRTLFSTIQNRFGVQRNLCTQKPIQELRIGIIGMGHVGDAVIKNLQKHNFNVTTLLDIDRSRCEGFSCNIAQNPRELINEVDVVVSALPKPPHIKQVFEGPDGILEGLREDMVWIDHSTTDYEQTQHFAQLVSEKKAHLMEAPVTGGLEALKKGQMTTLVAGEKDVFEFIRPLLDASYCNVLFTGPLGTALIPKAISNTFASMICIAAAEALMICKRAGMDEKTTFDAFRASTGNSFVLETAIPMICQGTYDPSFTLDLHCKDNQLVHDSARRLGVPIELLGHVQQMYNRALSKYGPDAPCYIPAKLVEDACQESLQNDAFKDWSYSIENVDGSAVIRHKGIETVRTGHPMI